MKPVGLPRYAELHCVSNFSFLKGASHPEELVIRALELGYAALAITDECSLAGVVRAHAEARQNGLKLLIGASFVLDDGLELVVIALNREGYGNLSEIITLGRMRCEKGRYRLSRADFDGSPQPADQIPAAAGTIGHLAGLPDCIALWIPARDADDAALDADARWFAATFPPRDPPDPRPANFMAQRAWIALRRTQRMDDKLVAARMQALSERTGLPCVATGHVQMHARSRKPLADTMTAIRIGRPVAECGDALAPNAERHLRSRGRLARLFNEAALEATVAIADQCDFSLKELGYQYPKEIVPEGQTQTSQLRILTEEGLVTRYPSGAPAKVRQQIERELALIAELKYEAFFLTVHDIVRYARSVGILCQGRGSAANSAVCFCLGITGVDPALQETLFERFLTKERNEPPDIDVDFEHQRREEVIQYIFDKYGRHRTALAATVIAYRTRSSIRDVGKALGLDPERVDRLSSSHAWWDGGSEARERLEENGFDPDSPIVRKLIELTATLRSFPRHLSQHVGGFVISADKLSRMVPIENAAMERPKDWDDDRGRRAIYEGLGPGDHEVPVYAGIGDIGGAGFGHEGPGDGNPGYGGSGSTASGGRGFGDANSGDRGSGDAACVDRGSGYATSGDRGSGDAAPGDMAEGGVSGGVASDDEVSGDEVSGDEVSGDGPPGGLGSHDVRPIAGRSSRPRRTKPTLFPTFRSVIQWDKDDLEELGLLKVDVLALGMLSAMRRALELCGRRYGRPFPIADVPKEDPRVYDMICRADTIGVFQIESRAQMSMLPRLLPRRFYDLVVEVAIVRPGPIQGGMVHPYLKAREAERHGKLPEYPQPGAKEALERTLGVPIFQEQVMQLMMLAADFSAGEADKLRRAMAAWKRKGGLGPFHDRIVEGMVVNGYERDYAERIFKQVEGFGEYGFPESHAAAFAFLVYVSSWIKCHEPAVFLAAMLNSQPLGFYSSSQLIQDAKRHDVEVRPIDVMISEWDATLEEKESVGAFEARVGRAGGKERAVSDLRDFGACVAGVAGDARDVGFDACKAGGAGAADSIANLTPDGRDLPDVDPAGEARNAPDADFATRRDCDGPEDVAKAAPRAQPAVRLGLNSVKSFGVDAALRLVAARRERPFTSVEDVGRRAALSALELEALAAADALQALAGHRREARWQAAPHRLEHDLMRDASIDEPLPTLPTATEGQEIVDDYAATGFTLRRHPLALLRPRLRKMGLLSAAELHDLPDGCLVRTTGIVTVRQRPGTAKGTIFVTLEDETGVINVIVWNHVIASQRRALLSASLLTTLGTWQRQGEVRHVVAERLIDHSALTGPLQTTSRDFH